MNKEEKIYYFVFRREHPLYGNWIEISGGTEREASEAFRKRYIESHNTAFDKSITQFHKLGCYEKLYLPLPEDINSFDSADPFADKTRDFIWANIGMQSTGKSFFPLHHQQSMGRIKRDNNQLLIFDDYRSLPNKPMNIHEKINFNAIKSVFKKHTKDFKITYGKNSDDNFPYIKK